MGISYSPSLQNADILMCPDILSMPSFVEDYTHKCNQPQGFRKKLKSWKIKSFIIVAWIGKHRGEWTCLFDDDESSKDSSTNVSIMDANIALIIIDEASPKGKFKNV